MGRRDYLGLQNLRRHKANSSFRWESKYKHCGIPLGHVDQCSQSSLFTALPSNLRFVTPRGCLQIAPEVL